MSYGATATKKKEKKRVEEFGNGCGKKLLENIKVLQECMAHDFDKCTKAVLNSQEGSQGSVKCKPESYFSVMKEESANFFYMVCTKLLVLANVCQTLDSDIDSRH